MRAFPNVAFASIDSKSDAVQIAFYEALGFDMTGALQPLLPTNFNQLLETIYARYRPHQNWVSYSVNDYHHMFLIDDVMYGTSPRGSKFNRTRGLNLALEITGHHLSGDAKPLPEWLSQFPVQVGHNVTSECVGVAIGGSHRKHVSSAVKAAHLFGSLLPSTWKTSLKTTESTMKVGLKAGLGPAVDAATRLTGVEHCAPGQSDKAFHRTA